MQRPARRRQRIGGWEGLQLSALGWAVETYALFRVLGVFIHCAAWWWGGKLWSALTHDGMVFGTAMSVGGTLGLGTYLLCVL